MGSLHIKNFSMDMDEFEKIVNDSVNKIPENFRSVLEKENIKTVVHEIGHYFGFSEEELQPYL